MKASDFDQLTERARLFVNEKLRDHLPKHLHFHNAVHTGYVVLATQEIGRKVKLNQKQMQVVTLAAWFHDIGYTEVYKGHELVSVEIATQFLIQHNVEAKIINEVVSCILATRFPQHPQNLMEMVICDADFYHFSVDHYSHFARVLKMEWEEEFKLVSTQHEWDKMNFEMLQSHQYFTAYGKTVLQQKKEKNMLELQQRI